MLPYWFIASLVVAYMAALFVVAWRGDHPSRPPRGPRLRAMTYALSFGIYCTSWTYYGAVGTAARTGWEYLGVYVGPTIVFIVFFPLWRHVLDVCKREKVGSIADFLSARYSKSRAVGALVTIVAVSASLPYITLQLKSLASAWRVAAIDQAGQSEPLAMAMIAALLAAFAVLFGARKIDLTMHHRGLTQAIAVESVVKLCGILLVAMIAIVLLTGHEPSADSPALIPSFDRPPEPGRFITLAVLSAAALFCVPRQFHMGFVEAENVEDVRSARWMFPVYLLLFSLAIIPIATAGQLVLQNQAGNPDYFVLTLPLERANRFFTIVALLGGFSAAAAMVVVETVALSGMVSNHLILPLTGRWWIVTTRPYAARTIVAIRQVSIVLIIGLAVLYFLVAESPHTLSAIGEISFVGAFQLAPALFAGVLWRRAHARGAIAGIAGGAMVWTCTMVWPQLDPTADVALLDNLAAMTGLQEPLVLATLASLAVNSTLLIAGSLLVKPRITDRIQAVAFIDSHAEHRRPFARDRGIGVSGRDLRAILERFLGEEAARRGFETFEHEFHVKINLEERADSQLVRSVERMLAGALGSTAARKMISRALSDGRHEPDTVMRYLDETAQAVQFNRELLQTTLDNLSQGVSVVDAELRLVAWNRAYIEMFGLPAELIHVSRPIEDIIRWLAQRDGYSADEVSEAVCRRLSHLRRRHPRVFERVRPDGRVFRAIGGPMPGGGYVTSYTDVTDLRRAAEALVKANESLESRVTARTAELAAAKAEAEAATESKTRFLAAASHDVLQPLHAARLFIGSLTHDLSGASAEIRNLLASADRSISGAHKLLRALLDLSRLEQGGIRPRLEAVSLEALLTELKHEFEATASDRDIRLRFRTCRRFVFSDRNLLRSVLQNLVSNAVRYTPSFGHVLVGVRRKGEFLNVEVWDTGPGIPASSREFIFKEFAQLSTVRDNDGGVGLGLAIVRRIIGLLGHQLSLDSSERQGSVFTVRLPRASPPEFAKQAAAPTPGRAAGLKVLCVDDEPEILTALRTLLIRWGVEVECAGSVAAARALMGRWDAAFIDHHLSDGLGLELIQEMGLRLGRAAVLTADPDLDVANSALLEGVILIRKPARPATLRAFLNSVSADTPRAIDLHAHGSTRNPDIGRGDFSPVG